MATRTSDYTVEQVDAIRSKPRAEWTDEEFETIIGYETALRLDREDIAARREQEQAELDARIKANQDAADKALAEFESIREWMREVQR